MPTLDFFLQMGICYIVSDAFFQFVLKPTDKIIYFAALFPFFRSSTISL